MWCDCEGWCCFYFFFSSRGRHTRWSGDWSSDVCSSDLIYLSQISRRKWVRVRSHRKRVAPSRYPCQQTLGEAPCPTRMLPMSSHPIVAPENTTDQIRPGGRWFFCAIQSQTTRRSSLQLTQKRLWGRHRRLGSIPVLRYHNKIGLHRWNCRNFDARLH